MGRKDIVLTCIETNNLKGITVSLKRNAINLIIGPSGSGKSSLAYDTVAAIGQHELAAMYADSVHEPVFKVESYSNMMVSIPIKQLNNNNNVRSTIGTYFSLSPCLAKIFSSLLDLPYDYFVLNKVENVCPFCMGIGYIKRLDENKIINYDVAVVDVPIRCWIRGKEFYKQIIKRFCDEQGIDSSKTFRELSIQERQTLLYGISQKKYGIKYSVGNRKSSRTTKYYGIMTGTSMLKNFSPSDSFYSHILCDKCGGEKFSSAHREKKLCGFSIGELLLQPFEVLLKWVETVNNEYKNSHVQFSLNQLKLFASKAVELNLGHLFLNRSIPSLSGGELQRLRLVQVFASQLSDMLIVLDEPTAGLSELEAKAVYTNIKALAQKHTLLIVDHHSMFFDDAASIIALGEGSGVNGGNLVDAKKYIRSQRRAFTLEPLPVENLIHVSLNNNVYNYNGVQLDLAEKRMNIISGPSGIGKSTLLREYFTQFFENYTYINQKPIVGNSRSTVATDLNIFTKIVAVFAKEFETEKSFFSNMVSADGACPSCAGTGIITYGSELQGQVSLVCKECDGTGFNKKLAEYTIHDKSILDIWKMTIDEAYVYFSSFNKPISKILQDAQDLLLGHLQVGQLTSSLSGGENLRVKLLKSISTDAVIYGIDEPFKGLNNEEIYTVARFLSRLEKAGKTIIVVDHEVQSFPYFSKHIILQNRDGILCENSQDDC